VEQFIKEKYARKRWLDPELLPDAARELVGIRDASLSLVLCLSLLLLRLLFRYLAFCLVLMYICL
jgi:hypothetical protein